MDGQRVKELRLERGWNQTVLSYHSGLAQTVISEIETGKREPSYRTLHRLADAFGVSVPELFVETAPKALAPPETPEGGAYLTDFFTRRLELTADRWWGYFTEPPAPRPTAGELRILWREVSPEADAMDAEASELAPLMEGASEEDRQRMVEAHERLLAARDALYGEMKRRHEEERQKAQETQKAGTLKGHEAR